MSENADSGYYSHVRQEIAQLLPERLDRVLEIGCGRGETLAWLRRSHGARYLCGVELMPDSAQAAAAQLDRVLSGNFESLAMPSDFQRFDLILCLDVLEHFVDPWSAVRRLDALLAPGGVLIASVPNVRYFRVSLDLLLRGRWQYQDDGILDRTHLRFFTRQSAIDLLQCSGLQCQAVAATGLEPGRKARYLNWATLNLLRPLFEYQYLIKVCKAAA